MVAVSIEVAGYNNSASASLEGREYTAEVYVRCDDAADTGHTALEYMIANGYGYGSHYDAGNDQNALTRIYQIDPPKLVEGSCYLWKSTVHYRSISFEDQDTNDANPDENDPPQFRRPKISISTVVREVPVRTAVYRSGFGAGTLAMLNLAAGQESAVVNSAGSIYNPPRTKDKSNKVVVISRLLPAVIFNDTSFPTDWINDQGITITDRKTTVTAHATEMKHLSWRSQAVEIEGFDLVEVTGEFEIKKGGWRAFYEDHGMQIRAEANEPDGRGGVISNTQLKLGMPSVLRMTDIFGHETAELTRLDGNGRPLAPGNATVIIEWSLDDEIDVSTLPFFAGVLL